MIFLRALVVANDMRFELITIQEQREQEMKPVKAKG